MPKEKGRTPQARKRESAFWEGRKHGGKKTQKEKSCLETDARSKEKMARKHKEVLKKRVKKRRCLERKNPPQRSSTGQAVRERKSGQGGGKPDGSGKRKRKKAKGTTRGGVLIKKGPVDEKSAPLRRLRAERENGP